AISQGDFIAAAGELDKLAAERIAPIVPEVPESAKRKIVDFFKFPFGVPLGFGGGRATGGPTNPGTAYVVGEKGPELFVPRSAGTVVPNNKLGGTVNQTFNIVSSDPILTAAEVVRRQRDAEFLAGV
ncbi:MAG: hypothetical protein ACO307_18135, partial [Ilumatobacteraceae bacterium]